MAFGLTINSVPMDISPRIWRHNRGLMRLVSDVAVRGDNTLIPGEPGEDPNPLRVAQAIYDLELQVWGFANVSATPYTNPMEGLATNLLYLRSNVALPAATDTVPVSLDVFGDVYTAEGQVLNWHLAKDDPPTLVVSYDLRIPGGIWTLTPP